MGVKPTKFCFYIYIYKSTKRLWGTYNPVSSVPSLESTVWRWGWAGTELTEILTLVIVLCFVRIFGCYLWKKIIKFKRRTWVTTTKGEEEKQRNCQKHLKHSDTWSPGVAVSSTWRIDRLGLQGCCAFRACSASYEVQEQLATVWDE